MAPKFGEFRKPPCAEFPRQPNEDASGENQNLERSVDLHAQGFQNNLTRIFREKKNEFRRPPCAEFCVGDNSPGRTRAHATLDCGAVGVFTGSGLISVLSVSYPVSYPVPYLCSYGDWQFVCAYKITN